MSYNIMLNTILQLTVFNKMTLVILKLLGKQTDLFVFVSSKRLWWGILDTTWFEHKNIHYGITIGG